MFRLVVSHPIDKVVDLAPKDLGVQNLADLELRKAVHLDGRGNLLDSIGKRVRHMRFQEADVEDRMNVHGWRKSQAKRRRANWTNDSKRTKATNIQFGARTDCGNVSAHEPHFLSWKERGGRPTTTIGGDLHCCPSFEELPLKDNLGLLELLDVGVRGWGWRIGRCGKEGHAGMETVVGEEGGEGGSGVLGIVVAEFRQGKEAGPVGLLIVAVDAEVLLQDRIEPLRLAIRLGMEGGGAVGVDSQKFQEPAPEV